MMTNLYPFLMGQAALAHERIPHFPAVDEPENHILAAGSIGAALEAARRLSLDVEIEVEV